MTPGRKFWTTTSAPAIRSSATARPASCWRSTAIDRLPRFWFSTNELMPLRLLGAHRARSPIVGDSTLTTSAPCSASTIVPNGPEVI